MLKLHGYSACREALVILEDHYSSSTKYESMEDFIFKLNRTITSDVAACSSIIDPDIAHQAIQKLSNSGRVAGDANLETQIPNTLSVTIKNVQHHKSDTNSQLGNDFNIHYNFLHKKLSSLPIFSGDFQLTKLSTLTASTQPSIRCICFGLLVKDISKIDGYTLIDSTGRVPVRITPETSFRNRLAYTNCIMIVEGVYVNPDDILYAANIGLPPILLDPIQDKSLACTDEKLVVLLRDLYLDEQDICDALDTLFTGYNSLEDPPLAFIMIGDFTREPCDPTKFRSHMKKLFKIIKSYGNLKECNFIFIPGLRDPLSLFADLNKTSNSNNINTLPRPPLTKELLPLNLLHTSGFLNTHLATNPAHIYLGDRLISLVSHSYLKELRKNLIYDLSDHREEALDIAKQIILSNGHFLAGISKNYHSSMNLWHRTDLLILADTEALGNRYDYNSSRESDTTFATLPSFSRSYNQFKVYYVTSGEIDDSQVSSNALDEIQEVETIEDDNTENDVVVVSNQDQASIPT